MAIEDLLLKDCVDESIMGDGRRVKTLLERGPYIMMGG